MHRWQNTEGEEIHHIQPRVCKYPHSPDQISVLRNFEAPENNGDRMATKIEVIQKCLGRLVLLWSDICNFYAVLRLDIIHKKITLDKNNDEKRYHISLVISTNSVV